MKWTRISRNLWHLHDDSFALPRLVGAVSGGDACLYRRDLKIHRKRDDFIDQAAARDWVEAEAQWRDLEMLA